MPASGRVVREAELLLIEGAADHLTLVNAGDEEVVSQEERGGERRGGEGGGCCCASAIAIAHMPVRAHRGHNAYIGQK